MNVALSVNGVIVVRRALIKGFSDTLAVIASIFG
jgi:hypothetical protein